MTERGNLLRITPEGETTNIDNEFHALRNAVGASFDFAYVNGDAGFYVDDEGMLNGSRLNTVASLMAGRVLYGNVVLTKGDTDDEGDTLPAPERVVDYATHLALMWRRVVSHGIEQGQDVIPVSNGDTVPAPTFTSFDSHEDMMRALGYSEEDIAIGDGQHRQGSI